jgi:hypothetical protein
MGVKLYCPTCYTANEHLGKIPKFCSECGSPFSESTASLLLQNLPPKPAPIEQRKVRIPKTLKNVRAYIEEEDEQKVEITDNEEVVSVPNIDKLEVEIQGSYKPNTSKFEQVAGSGRTGEGRERPKNPKPLSKKTIIKNWEQNFPKVRQSKDIGE